MRFHREIDVDVLASFQKFKSDFITTLLWRRYTMPLWLLVSGKVEEEKAFLSRTDETRWHSVISWSIMLDSWVDSGSVIDLTRNIPIWSRASFLSKWVAYPVLENWHWSNKTSPWCLIISSFMLIGTFCKIVFPLLKTQRTVNFQTPIFLFAIISFNTTSLFSLCSYLVETPNKEQPFSCNWRC